MDTNWPTIVDEFTKFLTDAGLRIQSQKEAAAFGNKILQLDGPRINVRVVSDRGVWYVEVADASRHCNEWYDAAILRDCLFGSGGDVLTLESQVEFIEANWSALNDLFGPSQEESKHSRLVFLQRERAKRRLPNFHHGAI